METTKHQYPEIRTVYGPHLKVQRTFENPSLCMQADADRCDINKIMARHSATGLVDHLSQHHGAYGDIAGALTYQESMDLIRNADEMFSSLPSKIRTQFDNDPGQFLAFCEDPDNEEEMVQMGIKEPQPPVAEPKPEPVSEPLVPSEPEPGLPLTGE